MMLTSDWGNYCDKSTAQSDPDMQQHCRQLIELSIKSTMPDFKKPVFQLLSGEETINGYLKRMAYGNLMVLYP